MLDLATFRTQYPEFAKVPDAMITGALERAALEIDQTVWGARQDIGHGLKAAHLLAVSPMGQTARLSSTAGESTYSKQYYDQLVIVAGMILRVV